MSLESWQAAIKEIPQIIAEEPNREKAILLAALYILEPHFANQDEIIPAESDIAAESIQGDAQGQILSSIEDELSDSEKYLKLWRETGNDDFKEISRDELRHFEILVKYIRATNPEIDLSDYMVQHGAILAKLV